MSLNDLLDIYIITYNRAEELNCTLKQLLDEKSPIKDFTINIIDNNSSDNTYDVVKSYMAEHENLTYEKNKYNIGGNANIVKAFYKAEKEYVWILADNDDYCWDSWGEVEEAISNKTDAIIVSNYGCPELSIAQCFNQASFLPGVIFKTSNIDDVVIGNMAFNISNMFPHLALFAKLINLNKNICIVQRGIVEIGDNQDKKTGKYIYTRGYDNKLINPLLKEMSWLTGYAMSVHMINDKSLRNFILTRDIFALKFNSARVFDYNKKSGFNSLYNLMCLYCVANIPSKIRFILNWICYYTIYKILYIYSICLRPQNPDAYITTRYFIRVFKKDILIKKVKRMRNKIDSKKYCPVLKNWRNKK